MKYMTQFSGDYAGEPGEENTLPSMTVPNQCYSIRELLERFVSGTVDPRTLYRDGSYEDDEPSFEDYDDTFDPAFDLADYTIGIQELERRKAIQVEEEWRKKQDKEKKPVDSPTPPPAEPDAEPFP